MCSQNLVATHQNLEKIMIVCFGDLSKLVV